MADAKTDTKTLYSVKNAQPGLRGLWSDGELAYIETGAVALAELSEADKARADASGYFEISKGSAADKKSAGAGDPPAPDGKTAN